MKSVVPGSCHKIVFWNVPLITGVIVINSHWHSHWLSHWLSLTLSLTFSPNNWLTNWLTDWLARSLTHSLTLTHTHTHSHSCHVKLTRLKHFLWNCAHVNDTELFWRLVNTVQVMVWSHWTTSHYLSRCWPESISPYYVTTCRPFMS